MAIEKGQRDVFENHHSIMLIIDPCNADIIDVNPAAVAFYGWSREEFTAKTIMDLNFLSKEETLKEMKEAATRRRGKFFFRHRLANGDVRDVEVSSGLVSVNGKRLLLSIVTDITDRVLAEQIREDHGRKLEAKVKETSSELLEMNIAMKVLLEKREKDRLDMGDTIFQDYELAILPFLEKLKASLTKKEHQNLMGILESNLKDMVTPFKQTSSDTTRILTPSEIQVVSLIKQGLSNKEIAIILNKSDRTVSNHRNSIRKKLGLVNKKINLRSFLLKT